MVQGEEVKIHQTVIIVLDTTKVLAVIVLLRPLGSFPEDITVDMR